MRIDVDGFGAAFMDAWSRIESRFLTLECWQTYREREASESQAAYERGDLQTARELLRCEAQANRPLYEDVQKREIEYARVRLVQEPLTAYLRYELLSYQIRTEMGENIEIVVCDPSLRLPDERYFDYSSTGTPPSFTTMALARRPAGRRLGHARASRDRRARSYC